MNFEEQFENKIKVKTLGGLIDVIDIHPNKQENEYPIFISSGWASTPELLESLLRSISKNGRRIITIDFKNLDDIKNGGEKYKTRESLKAKAIIDTLIYLNIKKVDIIGHSEGAVNTTLAIEISPNKFRNFLLVAPAGMIQNESFLNLAYRFTLSFLLWPIRKIKGNNRPFYHILQNLKFILFNPIQSTEEGYGLSKIYIGEKIKSIIEKGVIVNLIYFKDDVVFPSKSIKKSADENNIPFHIAPGTHNHIYSKPDIFWEEINIFLK